MQPMQSKHLISLTVFSFLYLAAIQLSIAYSYSSTNIASVWPASGVFVAALLSSSRSHWHWYAGIFFSIQVFIELQYGKVSLLNSLLLSLSVVAEAVLIAFILRKWRHSQASIEGSGVYLVLCLFACLSVVPIIAVLPAYLNVVSFGADFFTSLLQWSISDVMGILVVAPLLFYFTELVTSRPLVIPYRTLIATLLVQCGLVLGSYLIFSGVNLQGDGPPDYAYLLVPALLYSAIRLGPLGSALSCFTVYVTTMLTSFLALSASMPAAASVASGYQLQLFLFTLISMTLILSVVGQERRTLEDDRKKRIVRSDIQHDAFVRLAQIKGQSAAGRSGAIQNMLGIIADTLGVARVGLWQLTAGNTVLKCDFLHVDDGYAPADLELLAADYPAYFEALRAQIAINVDDAATDPRTREFLGTYLRPLGITSMLDAFVTAPNSYEGVLCCEQVGEPRHWQSDEVRFAIAGSEHLGRIMAEANTFRLESEQHEMAQQFARIEQKQALGNLSSGIAHDFNNLLNVILGYAEAVEAEPDNATLVAECIQPILRAVHRGSELSTRLMGDRAGAARASQVDVNQVVELALSMLGAALSDTVRVERSISTAALAVRIESGQLEDAILNICLNAIHAVAGHGVITVSTSAAQQGEGNGSLAAGMYAVVTIADDGCGMDDDVKARIFEPNFSTKGEAGNGLGLSQVKNLLDSTGGSITVTSTAGAGTTFQLYLPMA